MNERPGCGSADIQQACLRVADLVLCLDACDSGVILDIPECHLPFVVNGPATGGLTLSVRQGTLPGTEAYRSLFYDKKTWQLWEDRTGRYVFILPHPWPVARQITVDPDFSKGEVLGEFDLNSPLSKTLYPLENMDVILFVNWLATFGDFLLHAAGIAYQGKGYLFSGYSGVGKSTLANELATIPGVTVLGEDQVVVRRQKNRYMVYGTPWHTNPARCAQGGVPLKKIFFLKQTGAHKVGTCGGMKGVDRLFKNAFFPYYNRSGVERILATLSHLAGGVPFYTMGFQIGADVMGLVEGA